MNKITIELCAEDRARLDSILEALQGKSCTKCVQEVAQVLSGPKNEPQNGVLSDEKKEVDLQDLKKTFTEATDAPPWEEGVPHVAPKYTKADLQQKVVNIIAAGADRAKVRGIINEYAERVGLVPDDKVDEVMERLAALEG